MGTTTPWGAAQTSHRWAPGIMQYSTAGHGGFHLSAGRLAQVHPSMRSLSGYPAGWFEEDCDWAVVGLHFPADLVQTGSDLYGTPEQVKAESAACLLRWHPDLADVIAEVAA